MNILQLFNRGIFLTIGTLALLLSVSRQAYADPTEDIDDRTADIFRTLVAHDITSYAIYFDPNDDNGNGYSGTWTLQDVFYAPSGMINSSQAVERRIMAMNNITDILRVGPDERSENQIVFEISSDWKVCGKWSDVMGTCADITVRQPLPTQSSHVFTHTVFKYNRIRHGDAHWDYPVMEAPNFVNLDTYADLGPGYAKGIKLSHLCFLDVDTRRPFMYCLYTLMHHQDASDNAPAGQSQFGYFLLRFTRPAPA